MPYSTVQYSTILNHTMPYNTVQQDRKMLGPLGRGSDSKSGQFHFMQWRKKGLMHSHVLLYGETHNPDMVPGGRQEQAVWLGCGHRADSQSHDRHWAEHLNDHCPVQKEKRHRRVGEYREGVGEGRGKGLLKRTKGWGGEGEEIVKENKGKGWGGGRDCQREQRDGEGRGKRLSKRTKGRDEEGEEIVKENKGMGRGGRRDCQREQRELMERGGRRDCQREQRDGEGREERLSKRTKRRGGGGEGEEL